MKYIFLLLPILLWGARKEQIDLVQDWTHPNDQSFVMHPFMKDIFTTLSEKNIRLVVTDLKDEKDHLGLGYVVIFNKPACITKELLARFAYKKPILFIWDPPQTYDPNYLALFKRIYTLDDTVVDNKKFFKFYYPGLKPMAEKLRPFEERELVQENFKKETLQNFRFAFCFETVISGKIFECFTEGTVPIYAGDITQYIPKNCFIDLREFKDDIALKEHLKKMDKTVYEQYLKNIREFLKSDKAYLFSKEMFSVIFLEAIRFP